MTLLEVIIPALSGITGVVGGVAGALKLRAGSRRQDRDQVVAEYTRLLEQQRQEYALLLEQQDRRITSLHDRISQLNAEARALQQEVIECRTRDVMMQERLNGALARIQLLESVAPDGR